MKRIALAAAAAAVGLVIAVAGAEGVLRLAGYTAGGPFTVTEEQYQRVPGIFAPNQNLVRGRVPQIRHRIRIDSLGYRGTDFPRARPDGQFRILFVGDSFAWGDNVHDEDTLPAQLQALLTARCGSTLVINAGIPSTTITAQAAMALRGLVTEPQAVVLLFFDNDLDDLVHVRMWEQLEANRRAKSRPPLSYVYAVAQRTALWSATLDATRTFRVRRFAAAAGPEPASAADIPVGDEGPRGEYMERFSALADSLRALGIPLLFAAYPSIASIQDAAPSDNHDWVLGAVQATGTRGVDLLPELLVTAASVEDVFLLPYDGHPNPRGYSVAARTIAEAFQADSALSRLCRNNQSVAQQAGR